jgi:integrase
MNTEWVKDKLLAGLYKRVSRKDPTWAVKARQKGLGRVVTVTLGRCDLMNVQDARQEAKAVLLALSQGIHPNDELRKARKTQEADAAVEKARRFTLTAALEEFLGYKDYKPNTVKDATQSLARNFGDWMDRPLRSITREEVLKRFRDIKKRVKARRDAVNERNDELGLPPSRFSKSDGAGEAQRAFRYLTAIFNSFKKDSVGGKLLLVDGNPCDVLADKKVRKVLKPRNFYLTDEAIEALVDTLGNVSHEQYAGSITTKDADFMMLLLFTGLRVNEARTLRWSDINFKSGMFSMEDTKNHSTHTLPMTKSIEAVLKRRLKARLDNAKYVFPARGDRNLPASMSRTFERVCVETGFNFTPHDLRRTFATVASEMGVDVYRIGATLNHSKQGVTAGYIQTTVTMLKETLEAIEIAILKPYATP